MSLQPQRLTQSQVLGHRGERGKGQVGGLGGGQAAFRRQWNNSGLLTSDRSSAGSSLRGRGSRASCKPATWGSGHVCVGPQCQHQQKAPSRPCLSHPHLSALPPPRLILTEELVGLDITAGAVV